MKYLIILSALMFFVSCKNEENNIKLTGEFPVKAKLETEVLKEISAICPEELVYLNGYLIIANNCHEQLLQIVRLSDMKNYHFITKGRGPSEFSRLYFSGHKQGDSVFFRNPPLASAWISPNDLIKNKNESLKITEPDQIFMAENVFHFDNGWIYTDLTGQGFMVFLDNDGSIVNKTKHFPELSYDVSDEVRGYVYYSSTTYNTHHEKFVSALNYFPYIIITDSQGNYEKIFQTQNKYVEPDFTEGELMPKRDAEYYYGNVYTSDKYIYAYRMGAKLSDMDDYNINPVLEVYDWSGNAIAEFSFDRLAGLLDFDLERGVIYGVTICFEEYTQYFIKSEVPDALKEYFKNSENKNINN